MTITTLYLLNQTPATPKPSVKQSSDAINDYVTGVFGGGQDGDTDATIYPLLMDTVDGGSGKTIGESITEPGAPHYEWYKAFISQPLEAQTITGTIDLTAAFAEGNGNHHMNPRIYVYVWKADNTKGADIIAASTSATEATTTLTLTDFGAFSLSDTPVDAGDRIVIELESYDNNNEMLTFDHSFGFNGAISSGYESSVTFDPSLTFQSEQTVDQSASLINVTQQPLYQSSMMLEKDSQQILIPSATLKTTTSNTLGGSVILKTTSLKTPSQSSRLKTASSKTLSSTLSIFVGKRYLAQSALITKRPDHYLQAQTALINWNSLHADVAGTEHKGVTLWFINNVNKVLTINIYGSYDGTGDAPVAIGSPITISASSYGAITLLETTLWAPFIYVTVSAASAIGISGNVIVTLYRRVQDYTQILNLTPTDANTHTSNVTYW